VRKGLAFSRHLLLNLALRATARWAWSSNAAVGSWIFEGTDVYCDVLE
jgi:hypothetical protein